MMLSYFRLRAMTQTPPQYYIKWRSDVDRARLSGSTAHTAAANESLKLANNWTMLLFTVILLYVKQMKNS